MFNYWCITVKCLCIFVIALLMKIKYNKTVGKEKLKWEYLKRMYYCINSSLLFSITKVIINNLIKRFWQRNRSSLSLNRELFKGISHELHWFNRVMNYPSYGPSEHISLFLLTTLTETVNSQSNKKQNKLKSAYTYENYAKDIANFWCII